MAEEQHPFDTFAQEIWNEVVAFQEVNRVAMKRVKDADPAMYEQVGLVEAEIDRFVAYLQAEPDMFNVLVIFCQHRDQYLRRMSANIAAAFEGATKH